MMELPQATCEALRCGGVDLLAAPQRFVGTIMDLIDNETTVATILYNYCDERLLGRLSDASRLRTSESLLVAYKGCVAYLRQNGVDRRLAHTVSQGLVQGLSAYLGMAFSAPEPLPRPESATPPQASPARQASPTRPTDSAFPPSFVPPRAPMPEQTVVPTPASASAPASAPAPPRPAPDGGGFLAKPRSRALPLAIAAVVACVLLGVGAYLLLGRSVAPGPSHPVTISFNANGADAGTVSAIDCMSGDQVTLPNGSALQRDGYVFKGWSEERDGQHAYQSGDSYVANSDVTLFAQWAPSGSTEPSVISCDRHTDANGSTVVVLTVQNRAGVTVDLQADFTFANTAGTASDKKTDQALSVGSGETTILEGSSSLLEVGDVSYTVTSSQPKYSDRSIYSCVTLEEVSCTQDGLTVRISNKGDAAAVLWYCTAYGTSESNEFAYLPLQFDDDQQQLEAGQSRTVVFEGDQWTKLDYEVYLFGFAT